MNTASPIEHLGFGKKTFSPKVLMSKGILLNSQDRQLRYYQSLVFNIGKEENTWKCVENDPNISGFSSESKNLLSREKEQQIYGAPFWFHTHSRSIARQAPAKPLQGNGGMETERPAG